MGKFNHLPGVTGSTTASGAGKMTLPSAEQLQVAGLPASIAIKVGGKEVPITVSTTSGLPSAADLVTAIDQLSEDKKFGSAVSKAVAKAIGLDNQSLGTSESERAESVIKFYPKSGDLGAINPSLITPYSTPPKLLTTTSGLGGGGGGGATGAIPAAATQFIDGVLKKIKAPINSVTVLAMRDWLANEQGGPDLPTFVHNQGNPLGIQTPAAKTSGAKGDLQTAIDLTANEITQHYGAIAQAFQAGTSVDDITTQIVGPIGGLNWNGNNYGGTAVFAATAAGKSSGGSASSGGGGGAAIPAISGSTQYEQYTSIANADNQLQNWGLDTPSMDSLVENLVAKGVVNLNEIMQQVRQSATYKQAFPGLAEYNSRPGQIHMTEAEYRTYSQSLQDSAQQYGGVRLTQAQVAEELLGNVSASEFQQRVQDIGVAVANADPNTKAILQKEYGINPAHLFAYYANPKESLPDMQRAIASGDIQDYASRIGLGGLTVAGAGQLADMAKLAATQGNNPLGVGISSIEGSLLTASKDSALLASNPGAAKPMVNTTALIGSQLPGFGGTTEKAAQTEVERAEQAKAAPFEAGGGFVQSAAGITGIGSAKT